MTARQRLLHCPGGGPALMESVCHEGAKSRAQAKQA